VTGYSISKEIPEVDEFIALRLAAGLSAKTTEAAQRGLPASLFSVCVRDNGRLIGMGRVIGDGGCNFEVVDVAVHPEYQRRGLGYQIMEVLMNDLRGSAPKSAYVCLIADHGAPALYEKFGFELTAPDSVGMAIQF
jgi:ribosomal protein S18 acetylase RimI-like enzyme